MNKVRFGSLFQVPLRNGVYVKSDLHGAGTKIVNMGELFSFPFVSNQPMSRVQLSDSEKATSLLEDGDLLFGRRSLVESGAGKCAVVICPSEPLTFESSVIRVRLDKMKAYPLFYYYWFKSPIGQATIRTLVTGSNVKGIKGSELKEIVVDCPSIEIQKKIANTLFLLDKKIEANNTLSSKLESLARLIYDYWFLQFEFPNEEGEPYRSSGGKMAWNEELKRDIPEGWSSGTLSDYGNIVGGGTPSTTNDTYYTEPYKGIAWLTPYDLANTTDKYIEHGARDITKEGLQKSSAVLMPAGSVLMTSRAPIGYLAISKNEICTNQGFKSIVPNKKYGKEFVYNSLNALMPYIKSQGVGSTFSEISGTTLKNLPCLCPDVIISNKFEKLIEKFAIEQSICESENRELTSFRDFLLPLLMNGQVTFEDDKETAPLEE